MGTTLTQRGLPVGQPPELYTLEQPHVVAKIHREFLAAGAQVLQANTFNANRCRLKGTVLADQIVECNRRAVAIARAEAGENGLVLGSLGPSGMLLAPAGDGTEQQVAAAYEEQASILEEAGADAFLIETMHDLREALAALGACRRMSPRPVIVTMTFTHTPRGYLTLAGDGAGDALAELASAGASAVGANCNLTSAEMVPLAAGIRRHVTVPVLMQPSVAAGRTVHSMPGGGESPADFARNTARMVEDGVEMVGGCCGTTPEFIAQMRQELKAVRPHRSAPGGQTDTAQANSMS